VDLRYQQQKGSAWSVDFSDNTDRA